MGKNKIQKITAVDQAFDNIKALILDGSYKVNDKLPSETAFAEMFGLNRLTIRAALQKLNTLGVVEIKVGDGTYVREFSPFAWISQANDFFDAEKYNREIHELRKTLEIDCCRLAILYATDEEKENLRTLTDSFLEVRKLILNETDDNKWNSLLDQILNLDIQFHELIFKMSHNRLFYWVYLTIFEVIKTNLRKQLTEILKYHDSLDKTDNHKLIYDGIITNNIEICQNAYDKMLSINSFLN